MESANPAVRLKNNQSLDLPLSLLRQEYGIFLCYWSLLVGLRCAQILNVPLLLGLWSTGLFLMIWLDVLGGARLRNSYIALALAVGTAGPASSFLVTYRNQVFAFLDKNLAFASHASLITNWVLLCFFFCTSLLAGRVLSRLQLEGSRFFLLLPWVLVLFVILKNKVIAL